MGGEADLVVQMTPYIAACIIAQIDDTKDQGKAHTKAIVYNSMDQELMMPQRRSRNVEKHSLMKLNGDLNGSESSFGDAKPKTRVDS